MEFFSRHTRAWADPADVFVRLYSQDSHSFWLDRERNSNGRYSVIGHSHRARQFGASEMYEELEKYRSVNLADNAYAEDLPFTWRPGFVGWFDYLADALKPEELSGTWLEAREALVFDHDNRGIWFAGFFENVNHFEEWMRGAMLRLGICGGQASGYLKRNVSGSARKSVLAHSDVEYLNLIHRAKIHIATGDIYQLCLTNRIDFEHDLDPLATFMKLRSSNPSPYSSYIRAGDKVLVSSSPEQFLSVSSEGDLSTRPIKGTRPRHEDEHLDAGIAAELGANQKERAENLMIVDLMRNDLARVSHPESVTVSALFEVEPHATVHQLVSTVTAKLRPGISTPEIIASAFPAGSMTGAPKIRAMQLIRELEGVERGTYSGAAGAICSDGGMDLGMTIRSLVFDGDKLSIGVGGGITSDSKPDEELAEIKLKAAALLAVIGADDPWARQ